MGSPRCRTCDKCGSTYAESPDTHLDPEPHRWTTYYHQSTGKPYRMCDQCTLTDGYEAAGLPREDK
jgi:hypothetical protein